MSDVLRRFCRVQVSGLETTKTPDVIPPKGSSLPAIRLGATAVAVQRLLSREWFSITDFDTIVQSTGIVPDGELVKSLRLIHCVNWRDMPKSLREDVQSAIIETFAVGLGGGNL